MPPAVAAVGPVAAAITPEMAAATANLAAMLGIAYFNSKMTSASRPSEQWKQAQSTAQSSAQGGANDPNCNGCKDPKKKNKKFKDKPKLDDHFKRHGADFNATDAADYQQKASDFMNSDDKNILQATRPNGDIVRFNPQTDEFGVESAAGDLRTYYKPDPAVHGMPSNLDYFKAQ